jgi:hypothetical protein
MSLWQKSGHTWNIHYLYHYLLTGHDFPYKYLQNLKKIQNPL